MASDPQEGGGSDGKRQSVLVGLVGKGIQLSRTPAMHEAAGRALGLNYVYQLIDLDRRHVDVETVLDFAECFGFSGLNVTFPFKQSIVAHLDELSRTAHRLGAVNTVVFRDGKRFGHNTDLWGFSRAFTEGIGDATGERVLLVGAGGAGVAVADALLAAGVGELVILDKVIDRAVELADNLNARFGRHCARALGEADQIGTVHGLVNATPVGMASKPGIPVDDGLLASDIWVVDIIYFPLETELLRRARERGCRTMNGSMMAVYQAVRAFELFSGAEPDVGRMKAVFESFDKEL